MIHTKGSFLIVQERSRQIEIEGYDLDDDVRRQPEGELAIAAWCYLGGVVGVQFPDDSDNPPPDWPWDLKRHWKPTPGDPIRQLVKAGALIAAEIDRRLAEIDNT